MSSPRRPLAPVFLFLALTLSAVTNEVELPREPASREVGFYAHTGRVVTPTGFPNGTVLAVYDDLGRVIGSTQQGWLFGEDENHLVGSFRATLPGPGRYSSPSPRKTGKRTGRTC